MCTSLTKKGSLLLNYLQHIFMVHNLKHIDGTKSVALPIYFLSKTGLESTGRSRTLIAYIWTPLKFNKHDKATSYVVGLRTHSS